MTDWLIDWLIGCMAACPSTRLVHLRTDWLPACLLACLPTCLPACLTGWLIDWLTDRLTDWPTDRLTDWPTDRLTDWPTDRLTDWLTDKLGGWVISYLILFFGQIGLVKFSSEAATPTGYNNDGRDCYSKRLADATPINIKYLKDFVDTLFAKGTWLLSKK